MKFITPVLYVASIFGANWLISNVGAQFDPNGPHLIPVWWGVMAPSGVLAVGLGFTFRDLVQKTLGRRVALGCILVGATLSASLSPSLALASGVAFLVSEGLDMAVYTPLERRHLTAAVLASNGVGLVVDSIAFLLLAFGSLELLLGQVLGKLWMTLVFLPVIHLVRRYI